MAMAYTKAAARTLAAEQKAVRTVFVMIELEGLGFTRSQVKARLAARRWQKFGRAYVLHRGALSRDERREVALANSHASVVLASFTALEKGGLKRWERERIYLLGPMGIKQPRVVGGIDLRLHRSRQFTTDGVWTASRCQKPEGAAILAATTLDSARSVCGLMAAVVQQQLTTASKLGEALQAAPAGRNHRTMLLAAKDITMGADALAEIDFGRLCRRHGLPEPMRQAIRVEPDGRRRYLDAEFVLRGGQRKAVEVDGAIHLVPEHWFSDQFRQNEVVIGGTPMLRFPSFAIRSEDLKVVDQLRRFLAS